MIKAIHFNSSKQKGVLVSDRPRSDEAPYNVIMHVDPTLGNNKMPNWSGDPQFMFTTFNWMSTEYPKMMAAKISEIIAGKGSVRIA